MDRIIPIVILVFLVIVGHVLKRIELSSLIKRRNFTLEYRNKFRFHPTITL
ncbi:hypothetical protein SAMN05192585_13710 [Acetanaerobacterium elongatum]|uniref:Uncharacterized protein n=1 Tax=Acetanaerobacterium elongatum TaxID=258515 RepID=A0A1H0EZV7_9FIRM|nr:hypothetical protein SAMN05192585_13710 [Acetanaerobacterium elongatum]